MGNTCVVPVGYKLPETLIPEKSEFPQGFHARRRKKLKSDVVQGRNLFLGRGFRQFLQIPENTAAKMGAGLGLLSGEGDDIFPPDQGFLGRLSYALLSLFKPNCQSWRDAQG